MKQTKASRICKEEGIRFAEDLTQEDWKPRRALRPRMEKAREEGKAAEGKAAGFRGSLPTSKESVLQAEVLSV